MGQRVDLLGGSVRNLSINIYHVSSDKTASAAIGSKRNQA